MERKEWENASGVKDPTPYNAMKELMAKDRAAKMMKTLKCMSDLGGYEVMSIEIKERKSGVKYAYKSE